MCLCHVSRLGVPMDTSLHHSDTIHFWCWVRFMPVSHHTDLYHTWYESLPVADTCWSLLLPWLSELSCESSLDILISSHWINPLTPLRLEPSCSIPGRKKQTWSTDTTYKNNEKNAQMYFWGFISPSQCCETTPNYHFSPYHLDFTKEFVPSSPILLAKNWQKQKNALTLF